MPSPLVRRVKLEGAHLWDAWSDGAARGVGDAIQLLGRCILIMCVNASPSPTSERLRFVSLSATLRDDLKSLAALKFSFFPLIQ